MRRPLEITNDWAGFPSRVPSCRGSLEAMELTDPGRYVVAIHRASGVYYARVVNLPGCISKGASEVEALENARSTIRAYLALARLTAREAPSVSVEISA